MLSQPWLNVINVAFHLLKQVFKNFIFLPRTRTHVAVRVFEAVGDRSRLNNCDAIIIVVDLFYDLFVFVYVFLYCYVFFVVFFFFFFFFWRRGVVLGFFV